MVLDALRPSLLSGRVGTIHKYMHLLRKEDEEMIDFAMGLLLGGLLVIAGMLVGRLRDR